MPGLLTSKKFLNVQIQFLETRFGQKNFSVICSRQKNVSVLEVIWNFAELFSAGFYSNSRNMQFLGYVVVTRILNYFQATNCFQICSYFCPFKSIVQLQFSKKSETKSSSNSIWWLRILKLCINAVEEEKPIDITLGKLLAVILNI